MSECDVILAIVIIAVVIIGSALALWACCAMSGEQDREESEGAEDGK